MEKKPLFYYDEDPAKWLEYLKIYDENYNYYSAGLSGDEHQLHYSPATKNFTWNPTFDRFQEYWGTEIELPAMIAIAGSGEKYRTVIKYTVNIECCKLS